MRQLIVLSKLILLVNNILSAALKIIVKLYTRRFSEVYGNPEKFPIKENDKVFAKSPYSATKIAGDQLCHAYYRTFGLPITFY